MCMAIYIASPSRLPLVAWHEEQPAFYVEEAEAGDALPAREELHRAQNSRSRDVLTECGHGCAAHGFVVGLLKFLGQQSYPEKDRLHVSPDALGGESFTFEQLRMLEFPSSP